MEIKGTGIYGITQLMMHDQYNSWLQFCIYRDQYVKALLHLV